MTLMDTRVVSEPVEQRWPHISRLLRVDSAGTIEGDFISWALRVMATLSPAELAASYEEWADFFEYRLTQRADELANDPNLRYLVEHWTEDMAYLCRRAAVWARGEDPGEWIPQHKRRPDLFTVTHHDQ